MKKLLLASTAALGLASAVAWAGMNVTQKDTGGVCFEFTSGVTQTEVYCWSALGVLDVAPATTAADSAATNDTVEIAITTPVDTTGTNTHNALTVDMAIGNATGGTNAATAVQIDAITGDAQVTETAINIGSGFDSGITSASPMTLTGALGVTGDITILTPGDLIIGNGTPSVTQNGEDAYVEGTFEVDGASEFDGAVDFDSTITIDTTAIAEEPLKFAARGMFSICGDATTVNNNTVYYGPSQVLTSSATIGAVVCDTTAAGNVTEATADAPVLPATAIYPLGMQCWQPDSGNTITYTLRSDAAAITPAISVSIADNVLAGTASATATTAIASGGTVAVAVASSGDIGTIPFRCDISYAY